MSARALLAALKRRRELSVKLDGGKEIHFSRPPESDMVSLLKVEGDHRQWVVGIEHVRKYVTGWSGFTEADILGASVGSTEPAEFSPELWAEVCGDDLALVSKVADAILGSVVDRINAKEHDAGNSPPA